MKLRNFCLIFYKPEDSRLLFSLLSFIFLKRERRKQYRTKIRRQKILFNTQLTRKN